MLAARQGRVATVRALLDSGADGKEWPADGLDVAIAGPPVL
jgi:hypothetical protein